MDVGIIFLNKVMPVFLVIGLGFLFGKFRKLETKTISELILVLILPCFAFIAVAKIKFLSGDLFISAIAPIVVSLGTLLCVYLFLRCFCAGQPRGIYLPSIFSNAGNIAIPISLLAYGEEAVPSALIYMVMVGVLIFSLGIFIVNKKLGIAELFKQYVLYAILLGLLANGLQISIPNNIFSSLEMIAAIAIPMLLLILGYNLSKLGIIVNVINK